MSTCGHTNHIYNTHHKNILSIERGHYLIIIPLPKDGNVEGMGLSDLVVGKHLFGILHSGLYCWPK